MQFTERLQFLRVEKGIDEKELSDATGISESVIRLYEKGKLHIELEHLKKLADVFEVTPKLLLGTMFPDLTPEEALSSYRLVQELVETREKEKQSQDNASSSVIEDEPAASEDNNTEPASSSEERPASWDGYLKSGKVALFKRIKADNPFDDNEVEDHWSLYGAISSLYGNDLINYYYLRVQDDSMLPTVHDQAVVLVKKNLAINNNDLVVIMGQQGEAMLRRVTLYDDKIVIICDNTAYPTEVHNTADYTILGKVLWKTNGI
ncbi:MAG: LexA family transcriptional regulator [Syntrophomonadaceae bacterium]|nr:LexA family transcriptional regulator [Syntrophomonadaceae bacterium]